LSIDSEANIPAQATKDDSYMINYTHTHIDHYILEC